MRGAASLLAVLVLAGLQGCGREPTVTRVVPPTVSLPEDFPLHQPQAAAPSPPAPAAAAPASAPVAPATEAMGAPAAPAHSPLPTVRQAGDAQGAALLAERPLLLPVVGVEAGALADHYEQARGASRTHEAIDIMAARGTPVVAVDDGRIAKLFTSRPGGYTVYHFDPSGRLAYYYAHLDRYARGLKEGMEVKRGDLLGYVGSTGNADPAAPHLHFAVFRLGDPPRWWEGEAVNPYPALSRAAPAPRVASR